MARKFFTKAELMRMPLSRLQNLDVMNGEEEALVQEVVATKSNKAPMRKSPYTYDFPDIKNADQEQHYQKVREARERKAKGLKLSKEQETLILKPHDILAPAK